MSPGGLLSAGTGAWEVATAVGLVALAEELWSAGAAPLVVEPAEPQAVRITVAAAAAIAVRPWGRQRSMGLEILIAMPDGIPAEHEARMKPGGPALARHQVRLTGRRRQRRQRCESRPRST